jgi:hypothetical protein
MKYQKKQTKEQTQMKQQMIEGGLAARWADYYGVSILLVRQKSAEIYLRSKKWWVVTEPMYADMHLLGAVGAFKLHTQPKFPAVKEVSA